MIAELAKSAIFLSVAIRVGKKKMRNETPRN